MSSAPQWWRRWRSYDFASSAAPLGRYRDCRTRHWVDIGDDDLFPGVIEASVRIEPTQQILAHVKFLGELFLRSFVGQARQLGFLFQIAGYAFVKWASHVALQDRVRCERRIGVVRKERAPGVRVEFSRCREILGLLESRKRLAKVVAVLAVDFARREAVAVEQHLRFEDQCPLTAGALRRRCIDGFQC